MKIAHLIFFVFFCLLHSFCAYAQNDPLDSMQRILKTQMEDTSKVNTLNELSYYYADNGDFGKAIQYSNEATTLSLKLKYKKGRAMASLNRGRVYQNQSKYSEARNYFSEAINIFEELGNKREAAEAYMRSSATYWVEDNYGEALKNTYSALKNYEATQDKSGIANARLWIGYYYFVHENYQEAMNNYSICLKYSGEAGDENLIAQSYEYMAEVYLKQGNCMEALKKDSAALVIWKKLEFPYPVAASIYNIAYAQEKVGLIALGTGDEQKAKNKFLEALKNYLESLKLFTEMGADQRIAYVYSSIGKVYIKLGHFGEARKYLEKSLQFSGETKSKDWIKDKLKESYSGLAELDSIKGNFKGAYQNYKLYILYRDSLVNEETAKKSESYKMQYEYDKKEAIAKVEQEKKDAETKRVRNLQYTAIGIILLFAIFLYINSRQTQKAKTKIEKAYSELKSTQAQLIQSEKMASLGELTAGIAHEIQNPLNFVNNFSEVNKELLVEMKDEMDKGNLEDAKEIANDVIDNEEKINHHGKRADAIVKGMLQHSQTNAGQKEPTNINTLADEYLRLSYHNIQAKDKSFNATLKTDFDESIGNINIIPQDIARVLLNLYNNAFYAVNEKSKQQKDEYEPTVSVSSKKVNTHVEIKVSDNGNGVPQKIVDKIFQPFFTTKPTGQGTGLGLSLAYDIIKAHGGEIKVETKEGTGAEFSIHLPLQNQA